MRKPYFESAAEFFDRSSVPKEIADLWDEWRELDADTARLVRAAVSSRSPRQLRLAWGMLAARAEWCGRHVANSEIRLPCARCPRPPEISIRTLVGRALMPGGRRVPKGTAAIRRPPHGDCMRLNSDVSLLNSRWPAGPALVVTVAAAIDHHGYQQRGNRWRD